MKHIATRVFTSLLAGIFFAQAVYAAPGRIRGAEVDEGEFEIFYHTTRTEDSKGSKTNKQKHELGFEYGITDDWKAELVFKGERDNKDDFDPSAIAVELQRELTSQDDGWWLSSAILGEYVHDIDGDPNKWELFAIAEYEHGKWKHKANVILEEEFAGGDTPTELLSRVSSSYKVADYFKPAIEWQAEWGAIDHIENTDEQKHFIGPAVYGDLLEWEGSNGREQEIEFKIAYLFGVTDASEDGVLRFKLEYGIEF